MPLQPGTIYDKIKAIFFPKGSDSMRTDLIHQLQNIVDSSAAGDSNRTIARYILANLMSMDTLSVQAIAAACYASIATVSRFVRSLGFESFAQLKQTAVHYRHSVNSLVQDYWAELPYDTDGDEAALSGYLENLSGALSRYRENLSFEQLDRVAKMIHDAKNVALYGFYQPGLLAKQLQFLFLAIGRYTEAYDLVEDHEERARTMEKDDLAVFFSVNGNYVYGMGGEVVNSLQKRGVKRVLFTQNASPKLAERFDEVVLLGSYDTARAGYYKLQLATELLFSRYMRLYAPDRPESKN